MTATQAWDRAIAVCDKLLAELDEELRHLEGREDDVLCGRTGE